MFSAVIIVDSSPRIVVVSLTVVQCMHMDLHNIITGKLKHQLQHVIYILARVFSLTGTLVTI